MRNFPISGTLLATLLTLTGCGGGGGDSNPPNQSPVIQLANLEVNEHQAVTLTAEVTDDGQISTYHWTQTAGPQVALSGTDTASLQLTTPNLDEDTQLTFQLVVTDDQGASASATSTLKVKAIKYPLTLTGQIIGTSLPGATLTLALSSRETPLTTTADNDGRYQFSLVLDEQEAGALLSLEAHSATDSKAVLSAWLGQGDALWSRGTALNEGQVTGLAISPFTTAMGGLIRRQLQRAPETQAELDHALNLTNPRQWRNLTTLLSAVIDGSIALPPGAANTLALANDIPAYQDWFERQTTQEDFMFAISPYLAGEHNLPRTTLPPPVDMNQWETAFSSGGSKFAWRWSNDGTGSLSQSFNTAPAGFSWQASNNAWQVVLDEPSFEESFTSGDWTHSTWLTQLVIRPILQNQGQLLVEEERRIQARDINAPGYGEPYILDSEYSVHDLKWYVTAEAQQPLVVSPPVTLELPLPAMEQRTSPAQGESYDSTETRYAAPFQFNTDGTGIRLDTHDSFQWSTTDQGLKLDAPGGQSWFINTLRAAPDQVFVSGNPYNFPLMKPQPWPAAAFEQPLVLAYYQDALEGDLGYAWYQFNSDGTTQYVLAADYDGDGLTQQDVSVNPGFWTWEDGKLQMTRYRDVGTGKLCTDLTNASCQLSKVFTLSFGGNQDDLWTVEFDSKEYPTGGTQFSYHAINVRNFKLLAAPPLDVSAFTQ